MQESEALQEIRRVARTGLVVLTKHAQHRMYERTVSPADIRSALRNATHVKKSTADQASDWTATGPDAAADDLSLGVVLRGGIIVITVY